MRVLHVISSIDATAGGPAVALDGLARAQRGAGMEVSIISIFRQGANLSAAEKLREAGVAVKMIGPAMGALGRHPDLKQAVADAVKSAEVVHIHALWEEIQHLAAREARRAGRPYLIRPCGMLDPWSLAQSKWKKRIYMLWRLRRDLNRAAGLHFTTTIERDLTAGLGLKAPAIVEPNGLDLREFDALPARGEWRAKQTAGGQALEDRPVVLFMSRLHPKKGLELLLPAFARIGRDDAVLVIAGPGETEYEAKIRALASAEGVADRVIFTGMLRGREKLAALVDADLFVLPSYQENFGNVVIESLAAGVPVVISDQVNLWPEVKEARVGGVVRLEVEAIAEEMGRWLGDKAMRREAGERGRRFARENYDWKEIARRWGGRYGGMVGK